MKLYLQDGGNLKDEAGLKHMQRWLWNIKKYYRKAQWKLAKPYARLKVIVAGLLMALALIATYEYFNGYPITGERLNEHSITSQCNIKGNISSTGVKIYHVPSGQYYSQTLIDTAKGERWFCSQGEAMLAGWRKSKR